MKTLRTPRLTWIGSCWSKIWPHEDLISPIEISIHGPPWTDFHSIWDVDVFHHAPPIHGIKKGFFFNASVLYWGTFCWAKEIIWRNGVSFSPSCKVYISGCHLISHVWRVSLCTCELPFKATIWVFNINRVCPVWCNFNLVYTCRATVNFGTLKDGSL